MCESLDLWMTGLPSYLVHRSPSGEKATETPSPMFGVPAGSRASKNSALYSRDGSGSRSSLITLAKAASLRTMLLSFEPSYSTRPRFERSQNMPSFEVA